MDKKQALEIQRFALEAASAVDKAAEVVGALSKEDRLCFAVHIGEASTALHFGILTRVYGRYPELRPREELPHLSSLLLWEDVSLPESMSEAELDAMIFSALQPNWRKVAMIIIEASDLAKARGWSVGDEAFGARIKFLSDTGRVDSQGDLAKWRHSEVRLQRDA